MRLLYFDWYTLSKLSRKRPSLVHAYGQNQLNKPKIELINSVTKSDMGTLLAVGFHSRGNQLLKG